MRPLSLNALQIPSFCISFAASVNPSLSDVSIVEIASFVLYVFDGLRIEAILSQISRRLGSASVTKSVDVN
jgi:hypothetical protein